MSEGYWFNVRKRREILQVLKSKKYIFLYGINYRLFLALNKGIFFYISWGRKLLSAQNNKKKISFGLQNPYSKDKVIHSLNIMKSLNQKVSGMVYFPKHYNSAAIFQSILKVKLIIAIYLDKLSGVTCLKWNTYSEKIKINFIHPIFLKRTSFNLPGVTLVLNIETHTSNSLPVMFDIARKTGWNSHCDNTMSQQSFNLVHTELFFSFLSFKSLQYYLWLDCTANSFPTSLIE